MIFRTMIACSLQLILCCAPDGAAIDLVRAVAVTTSSTHDGALLICHCCLLTSPGAERRRSLPS